MTFQNNHVESPSQRLFSFTAEFAADFRSQESQENRCASARRISSAAGTLRGLPATPLPVTIPPYPASLQEAAGASADSEQYLEGKSTIAALDDPVPLDTAVRLLPTRVLQRLCLCTLAP